MVRYLQPTKKALEMKIGDEIKVVYCWGNKLKDPIIMYWTGSYSITGQPLLSNKKGFCFRVLSSDFSHLVNGNARPC